MEIAQYEGAPPLPMLGDDGGKGKRYHPEGGEYIMSQRSSWGSNTPARRRGYRTLRYWADLHDGRGYTRHCMTVKGSKREGARILAELRVKHDSDRPTPTLGQAYRLWYHPDMERMLNSYLENPRPGRRGELMKPGTFKQVESTWRVHVCPRFGDMRVTDIRYTDVQEWLDAKTEQTAQRSLSLLKAILRMCLMNGCVSVNVAEFSYRMPTKGATRGAGIWTLGELNERILPAVRGRLCEAAVILSAFDSCRTGEALAPMVSEIRRIERSGVVMASVPILRQVSNNGTVSTDGDLKNRWSPRPTVVPPPWSLRVLELRDEAEARGDVWLTDNGFGEPVGQRIIRDDFDRALDGAGIPRQQFRALRRSWRSWAAGCGIPSEILEKMMGHVGAGTTGRHYLKVTEDLIADAVARACSERPFWSD